MTPTPITLKVAGMTCAHCVHHVSSDLSALDEVAEVMVTLNAGGTSDVLVTLNEDIPDEKLAETIDEAGYRLVGVERG
ncbi:MAG: heavy-metal-associated domain-containing protein [Actinomycetales bacterium]|nr:heavy-metal-associated domain-containing protein [Actinomycetales bacterium]